MKVSPSSPSSSCFKGLILCILGVINSNTKSTAFSLNSNLKANELNFKQYSRTLSTSTKLYHHENSSIISRRRFAISTIVGTTACYTGTGTGAGDGTTSKASAATTTSTSTEQLQKIYDSQALTYDALYSESMITRKLDFDTLRQNLLSKAKGNVLELGVGTGLNLSHYTDNIDQIASYTAIDLSPMMLEQAKLRFEHSKRGSGSGSGSSSDGNKSDNVPLVSQSLQYLYNQNKVSFQIANVEQISSLFQQPIRNENNNEKNGLEGTTTSTAAVTTFDTIIDTFGLCVFPNPQLVLKEAKKILTPKTGQLLLLEHQDSIIGKVLSPTRKLSDVSNTCRYDDDVRGLIRNAGFDVRNNVQFEDLAGGFLSSVVATND